MIPWLSIVGIGLDGFDGLSSSARTLVDEAEVLVGGVRHLSMIPQRTGDRRERLFWPTPMTQLFDEILVRRPQRVCVLATGNPLWYGVGGSLLRHVPAEEVTLVPAPSAFSLACARLGWPLADVETLTLHGRPVELLQPFVQPGARLLALAEDGATAAAVARLLNDRGYGDSRLTVLERMGAPDERMIEGEARYWSGTEIAALNTLAIECVADPDAVVLPRAPGLPDSAYQHDGQLTKREVRAATLAALAPSTGSLLWDVGAGCGSVAIEWMRATRGARAIALERNPDRVAFIAANASALGTPQLKIVTGCAPAVLADLPEPDAVFIGGGLSTDGLFAACWDALRPGGRLVANVITVEGEGEVFRRYAEQGGELVRLAVSRGEAVGPFTGWRPLMPVTQWRVVKR